MKRRTLDIIVATGGIVTAGIIAILAFVIAGQAAFASDYVKEELGAQKISFPAASALTAEDLNWQPGSVCLQTFAGTDLSTGAGAECYAKYYIRHHMSTSAINAGFPGATYATLGGIRTDLSNQITAAKQANDTTKAADLQKKLDAATSLRTTMQTGETLSGLLLTVYGFSVLGNAAGLAGWALYALAAVFAVLAIAGFIHAFAVPEDEVVFGGRRVGQKPVNA